MMPVAALAFGSFFMVGTGSAAEQPKFQAINPNASSQIKQVPAPVGAASAVRRICPDPAVTEISFRIVSRTDQYHGRVEIKAVVKNLGRAPYESGPNQQSVQLYEKPQGGNAKLVSSRQFARLAPGAVVSTSYTRNWYSASPAEGEFPPSYIGIVSYDPDIGMDGNPGNDDCRSDNNRLERSGSGINDLLR